MNNTLRSLPHFVTCGHVEDKMSKAFESTHDERKYLYTSKIPELDMSIFVKVDIKVRSPVTSPDSPKRWMNMTKRYEEECSSPKSPLNLSPSVSPASSPRGSPRNLTNFHQVFMYGKVTKIEQEPVSVYNDRNHPRLDDEHIPTSVNGDNMTRTEAMSMFGALHSQRIGSILRPIHSKPKSFLLPNPPSAVLDGTWNATFVCNDNYGNIWRLEGLEKIEYEGTDEEEVDLPPFSPSKVQRIYS
jgi:hypothetical protein